MTLRNGVYRDDHGGGFSKDATTPRGSNQSPTSSARPGRVTALVVTYAATAKAQVIAATAYTPAVSQAMAAMAMSRHATMRTMNSTPM
jgi:hypothetical protein